LDGEGLRAAFFLQGCPARCVYCHNPDTQSVSGGGEYSPEELLRAAERCRPYFGANGGVTLSGGEPLLQAAALLPFAGLLKSRGINLTIDTSGAVFNGAVKRLLALADCILLDVKMPSAAAYKKHTGIPLENVKRVMQYAAEIGLKTVIRYVAAPTLNDGFESVRGIISLIDFPPASFEVLAFHKAGEYKYERLGRVCPTSDLPALSEPRRFELEAYAKELLRVKFFSPREK
jgi:pyruvate formate lyase activating enzyme